MAALFRRGERTDIEAAPDAIAETSNEAVDGIGKKGRDETEEHGERGPGRGQHTQGGEDGAGANQCLRGGGKSASNHDN
jgi:hypothetical protein